MELWFIAAVFFCMNKINFKFLILVEWEYQFAI
jgi:hypothetical protein